MGQEDYQRMMMMQQQQQQQQQGGRGMPGQNPAGFNQQVQAANWQQQQAMQQQQQMTQHNQQGSPYGMSRPTSAGHGGGVPYGGAPSPPNSAQNWSSQGGSYPFSPSPGHQSDQSRHMSATPAPQQQMQPQNASPGVDGSTEFELFNWAQQ